MPALRRLSLALALLVIGACGDSKTTAPPPPSYEGTYPLVSVNGQSLPYILDMLDDDNKVEVLAGVIVLRANGTFDDETDLRWTLEGEVELEDADASGTYAVVGNTITFTPTTGGPYSANINAQAGTITQNIDNVWTFVYQRQ
jgi:hypothetical protein